ncbi:MAG: acetyl-CoA carboxylase biotin carboxylase subunit [Candidatus Eisenbacteria bacterium]|nr:acetyl-CoA carboxylase biotin carboxylase subunit [Candidatus Eisenbacteria bacterium]
MFKKVLIANRGEIAVRVSRALKELGVGSVAVYSEADRRSLHVLHADEAYLLGPPPARESYLNVDKLLEIAKRCGAEAVHPGYGFLAENADFSKAVQKAGMAFIGPSWEAMNALGNKLAARRLASKAGVPMVPGLEKPLRNLEEALHEAKQIGYPVLLKASAGGGGKGMRVVRAEEEMASALELTRGEAKAAFSSDEVYLEKYLERPRHVEIQFLADHHGSAVYLGERDCSVQRRHQKLIEETPAPNLRDEVRRAMGDCAVRLALQAGYTNAGTAEFMVDKDQNFYFLEVNARLQVEHPVTEMVTGLDLVKLQLFVASGGKLPFAQADIQPRGHAIECRITAEDPEKNFMPSIGKISRFRLPSGPGLRNDAGVYPGSEITLYYDSLVGKLIAWGRDRNEARRRMLRALHEYVIEGVKTSIPFHRWALNHPEFVEGRCDVGMVAQFYHPQAVQPTEEEEALAVRAAALHAMLHPSTGGARVEAVAATGDGVGGAWKRAGRPGAGGRI